MNSRASSIVFVVLAIVIAALWLFTPPKPPKPNTPAVSSPASTRTANDATSSSSPAPTSSSSSSSAGATAATTAAADAERSHLADGLNSPTGTIGNDVRVLDEIFTHWTTNFPRVGNPVGTNAEITAALTGKNKLALALIPPDHPAINHDGELVDRWGTPFRFHQWSGSVTEVTSAGPDKKFATADDVSSQGQSAP